jgi:hypothetical protein
MDSRMTLQVAQEHIADLHRTAELARPQVNAVAERERTPVIALRAAGPDEAAELRRLAGLDSARQLQGQALVAVVDGELVAAISLSDGRIIANPLAATADARALLETRAAQLARPRRPRRGRWPRFRPRFA